MKDMRPLALLTTAVAISFSLAFAGCGSQKQSSSPPKSSSSSQTAQPQTSQPSTTPKTSGTITIGWQGGLTGFLAQSSLDAKSGTALAVAAANAKGGILGKKVVVDYMDTGTNPQKARQATQRLILSDHVVGILGDYYSPNTMAAAPIANKYQVPMIAWESQADAITQSGYHFMWRTIGSSLASTRALVLYAMNTLHEKRFVMVGGTDAFSQSNMKDFKKVVINLGGKIVGESDYNPATTKDFKPLISKFPKSSFDAIFLGGSPAQNALITKQARDIGYTQQLLTTSGGNRNIIWAGAGTASTGMVTAVDTPMTAINGAQYATPLAKRLEKQWVQSGHSRLSFYDGAHGYDATMLLLNAIAKAGTTQSVKINQMIPVVGKEVKGAIGTYTIEPNGDAEVQQFIMKWESDGHLHVIKAMPNKEVYGSVAASGQ